MPIYKAKVKCFVGEALRDADEEFEYNGEFCQHLELISGPEPQSPVKVPEVKQPAESVDYDSMTKAELEEYGRSIGLELNKNKTRETLISQLEADNI